MYAVVTGGGTSGHVMPAIAIIELLREAGHPSAEIAYVGARRGIETTLMPGVGVESVFLPVSGLQRSFSLRSLARNAAFPVRLLCSRWMAHHLLARWRPRVVVSVGGYASDPMSWAARVHGVPLVCVSYDRVAGLATRRQASSAAACAVAFEGSALPRATVTGAPVRAELRHLDVQSRRSAARRELGIPVDAAVVTVMGGSLGSGILNDAVTGIMGECAPVGNVFVFHICGRRFEGHAIASRVPDGIMGYVSTGYESRMADVYAATDLLVARAGASTVAEIATVGVASVLVPWSGAADDHQRLNAEWLGADSAAVVLDESSCHDGLLARTVRDLLADPASRERLAAGAREKGERHRSGALLEVIHNAAH